MTLKRLELAETKIGLIAEFNQLQRISVQKIQDGTDDYAGFYAANDSVFVLTGHPLEVGTLEETRKKVVPLVSAERDLDLEERALLGRLETENRQAKDDLASLRKEHGELTGGWGWNAIFYGFSRLFSRLLWVGVGGTVLFVLLRFLASSSPLAASFFGLFSGAGGLFIRFVRFLVPSSETVAGLVPKSSEETRDVLIDSIQFLKMKNPNATLADLLDLLAKDMDESTKQDVAEAKKRIGY